MPSLREMLAQGIENHVTQPVEAGGPGSGRHADFGAMEKHLLSKGFSKTKSSGNNNTYKGGNATHEHTVEVNSKTGSFKHTAATNDNEKVKRGNGIKDLKQARIPKDTTPSDINDNDSDEDNY